MPCMCMWRVIMSYIRAQCSYNSFISWTISHNPIMPQRLNDNTQVITSFITRFSYMQHCLNVHCIHHPTMYPPVFMNLCTDIHALYMIASIPIICTYGTCGLHKYLENITHLHHHILCTHLHHHTLSVYTNHHHHQNTSTQTTHQNTQHQLLYCHKHIFCRPTLGLLLILLVYIRYAIRHK